jgi:predicted Holliday junction resolvase-like endonuclease
MDDPNVVSPGILGFLAFFLLAVALYLLLRNMNGHLRRMSYRAAELEKQEQLAKAQQEQVQQEQDKLAQEQHDEQEHDQPDEHGRPPT